MGKLLEWIKQFKIQIIILFIMNQVITLSIGIVNYAYIDDVGRQTEGYTDFAKDYARVGSELFSYLIQGSRHLTDLGLMSSIITGTILTICGLVVGYSITGRFNTTIAIASVLIGANPWFLECISFRFDGPYMAMSVLFSVIPFIFWENSIKSI